MRGNSYTFMIWHLHTSVSYMTTFTTSFSEFPLHTRPRELLEAGRGAVVSLVIELKLSHHSSVHHAVMNKGIPSKTKLRKRGPGYHPAAGFGASFKSKGPRFLIIQN